MANVINHCEPWNVRRLITTVMKQLLKQSPVSSWGKNAGFNGVLIPVEAQIFFQLPLLATAY